MHCCHALLHRYLDIFLYLVGFLGIHEKHIQKATVFELMLSEKKATKMGRRGREPGVKSGTLKGSDVKLAFRNRGTFC